MHAHVPLLDMRLLAAPLIVRRPEDVLVDRQEVVMFLQDFVCKSPEEVLEKISGGHGGMDQFAHGTPPQQERHDMPAGHAMPGISMPMDHAHLPAPCSPDCIEAPESLKLFLATLRLPVPIFSIVSGVALIQKA